MRGAAIYALFLVTISAGQAMATTNTITIHIQVHVPPSCSNDSQGQATCNSQALQQSLTTQDTVLQKATPLVVRTVAP